MENGQLIRLNIKCSSQEMVEFIDPITEVERSISALMTTVWRITQIPNLLQGRLVDWCQWDFYNLREPWLSPLDALKQFLAKLSTLHCLPLERKERITYLEMDKELNGWKYTETLDEDEDRDKAGLKVRNTDLDKEDDEIQTTKRTKQKQL